MSVAYQHPLALVQLSFDQAWLMCIAGNPRFREEAHPSQIARYNALKLDIDRVAAWKFSREKMA